MQVSTTGILAIGMTLVMISGGIDLSIGQMMRFIGTGMAFMMRTVGLNDWVVVLLGVTVAVLFQVLMGFIISRTKLEPFIVSLGFMSIYKGFTYLITNGSEITIEGRFNFLGSTYLNLGISLRLGMPVIVFILLEVLAWLVLKYTKFGRSVYAVGGNENAAFLAGINIKKFKLLVYGVNGIFVAIATMVLLSRLGTGNPLIGDGKEIDVIAAVVVGGTALSGGRGNVWGNSDRRIPIGLHIQRAQYPGSQSVLAIRDDGHDHSPRCAAKLLQQPKLDFRQCGPHEEKAEQEPGHRCELMHRIVSPAVMPARRGRERKRS